MDTASAQLPEFPDQSHLGFINLEEYGDFYLDSIRENPQATDQDEIPGATGRFGLEPTNPIPIHGIPNSRIYLENLVESDGGLIRFTRNGSVYVPLINFPIDEYLTYDLKGKSLATVFISPYHKRCSEKAPEGFQTLDSHIEKFLD